MTAYTTIERSVSIDAPAKKILPHLSHLRQWVPWSPWEVSDDSLTRDYSGTDGAVGAGYGWSGNRKAGAGTMVITSLSESTLDLEVHFTRPFKSSSLVHFELIESEVPAPVGSATTVVWRLRSPKTAMSTIMGAVMNLDKLIGNDLARGLAALKSVVESPGLGR